MTQIITDRADLLGYKHGLDTGYGDRTYRGGDLPKIQQAAYKKFWKLGLRNSKKDQEVGKEE